MSTFERYYINLHNSKTKLIIDEMELRVLIDKCFINERTKVLYAGISTVQFVNKLAAKVKRVDVIENEEELIREARKVLREENIRFILSDLDEAVLNEQYDCIILRHVLEHHVQPVKILKQLKKYINNNGKIYITVPNAYSLHRWIGLEMKKLANIYELNNNDIRFGHKKLYTLEILYAELSQAGLTPEKIGGTILKAMTIEDMEKMSESYIQACVKVATRFPELSGELYAICF